MIPSIFPVCCSSSLKQLCTTKPNGFPFSAGWEAVRENREKRVMGLSLGQRSTEKPLKLVSSVLCTDWRVCCAAVQCASWCWYQQGALRGRWGSTPSQIPAFAADERLVGQSKPYNYCQMCSQQGSGFLFKIQSLQEHIGVLKLNQ